MKVYVWYGEAASPETQPFISCNWLVDTNLFYLHTLKPEPKSHRLRIYFKVKGI